MDQSWLIVFICIGGVSLILVMSGLYLIYMTRHAYADVIDSIYGRMPHQPLQHLRPVHA